MVDHLEVVNDLQKQLVEKENLLTETASTFAIPESEFTEYVSRGKLCHPQEDMYDVALKLYSYYDSIEDKCCIKRVMIALKIINESSHYYFDHIRSILNRYINTFTKGFVKKETEKVKVDKKKKKPPLNSAE